MIHRIKRSKSWTPFNPDTPIYRNTPNRTANGTSFRIGARRMDAPNIIETQSAVSLWSMAPTTRALSPGITLVDMTRSADTWLTARTVAAQIQGPPNNPKQKISILLFATAYPININLLKIARFIAFKQLNSARNAHCAGNLFKAKPQIKIIHFQKQKQGYKIHNWTEKL